MPYQYQFKPFLDETWDGAAKVVKATKGDLIRLAIHNGNDEEIFILAYDHNATSGLPTDPIDIIPCPPGYNVVFEGGAWSEFITGIVLKAAEAADGTGSLDANILISGRYK